MKTLLVLILLVSFCIADDLFYFKYLRRAYRKIINPRVFQPLQVKGSCDAKSPFDSAQLDSVCGSDCIKWQKDNGADLDACLNQDNSNTEKCLILFKDMMLKCEKFINTIAPDDKDCTATNKKDCCSNPKCIWDPEPTPDPSTGTSNNNNLGIAGALSMICLKSGNKYCMPSLSSMGSNGCTADPTYDFDTICGGCMDAALDLMKDPSMAAKLKPFCLKDGNKYCFQDYVNNANATNYITSPNMIKQKCDAPCPPNLVINQLASNAKTMADKDPKLMDDANSMAAFGQLICAKENNNYCFAKIMEVIGPNEGCTACSATCCHLCPIDKCPTQCEKSDNVCSRTIGCEALTSLSTSVSACCLSTLVGVLKKASPPDYTTILAKYKKCNINPPAEICTASGKKVAKSIVIKGKCSIVTAKKDKYVGPVTRDLEFNFKCTNCVKDVTFACYKPSHGKIQILQSSTDTSVSFNVQGVTDAQSDQIASNVDAAVKSNSLKTIETTATLNSDGANTAAKSSSTSLIPYLQVLIIAILAVITMI